MNNHQNDKQKGQIKMDTAPFVPGHRPQLFYVFSAGAAVKELATAACAGRQNVLHNKASRSQPQQIQKSNQINNKIQQTALYDNSFAKLNLSQQITRSG